VSRAIQSSAWFEAETRQKHCGHVTPRRDGPRYVAIVFRSASGAFGVVLDRVIADTGADASALPWEDFQQLRFDPALGRPGWMGGVGGSAAPTLFYRAWVKIDGQEHPCRLQVELLAWRAHSRARRA
jgi:hypothetical protein